MAFVFGIEGGFGQGKTMTGVIKAHQWALASGAKLFANFPLRGAYLFDHYTDWFRVADAHGSIIIFDESQSNFDSRQWGGEANIVLSQIFNYVRKMNCVFIFILPSYNNVDTRIRQRTEILIRCFKTPGGTIINHIFDYQDKQFGEFGRYLNKWVLPPQSQRKVIKANLYNTYAMVHRFPMPSGKKNVEEFFVELDRRHEAALQRFGIKNEIETLIKEDLVDVATGTG